MRMSTFSSARPAANVWRSPWAWHALGDMSLAAQPLEQAADVGRLQGSPRNVRNTGPPMPSRAFLSSHVASTAHASGSIATVLYFPPLPRRTRKTPLSKSLGCKARASEQRNPPRQRLTIKPLFLKPVGQRGLQAPIKRRHSSTLNGSGGNFMGAKLQGVGNSEMRYSFATLFVSSPVFRRQSRTKDILSVKMGRSGKTHNRPSVGHNQRTVAQWAYANW